MLKTQPIMIGQIALLVIVSACLPSCHGYGSGPPVTTNPEICGNMEPHHDTTAQTSAQPYEIVVGSTCYNQGQNIPVFVRVKAGETKYDYFEGFLVMARTSADGQTGNQGTFSKTDSQLQTLDCFGNSNSAIGHNTHDHWDCKTFNWTAPAGLTDDVTFYGTVVKNKETYWVGIMSSAITYESNCTLSTSQPECETSGTDTLQYQVIPMLFSLALMYILQAMLP